MAKVSYSQYSAWKACPHKWELIYKDKLSEFHENIHLLFGTSMHYVLQEYLTAAYSKTAIEADALNLNEMLFNKMKELYLKSKSSDGFQEFTSSTEMGSFYNDGVNILEFFKKNRSDYFSKKGYTLLGVEIALDFAVTENITFVGFLDVVIKDELAGDIYIYDFKTSTMGWKDKAKKDESKISQLLLYKNFYSKQHNIPLDKIHVEFIILKRKLYENAEFPQKRIQRFEPASGKPSVNKVINNFNNFIQECYTSEGTIVEKTYTKIPSKSNCQYCEFNARPDLCNQRV